MNENPTQGHPPRKRTCQLPFDPFKKLYTVRNLSSFFAPKINQAIYNVYPLNGYGIPPTFCYKISDATTSEDDCNSIHYYLQAFSHLNLPRRIAAMRTIGTCKNGLEKHSH
ncbi:hypothetical protein PPACK8108_LOCUS21940 [Phakopsora pachyrhizi]|uniref:Uncharacterized protein n=1 Tax=Phakopsora pachyrhizi TaxID=170000 RepID=A0AAV0BKI6_PHAPC|nr:hypothetical protein PPACK8108_LOCUS21940 [Phakopsora pachyrhizi]